MRKSEKIILIIIVFSFLVGAYFYPQMPEKTASHWNFKGEVDGYMPKFWGMFLMPLISAAMLLLFIFIPKIDPLKENIEKFRKYYDGFIALIILFLFYLYVLTILWNIGVRFDMSRLIAPAFSILFYYIGIFTENAKRNWFIGIRTPWTLSNEKVWDKTHKIGGKLFKIAGLIALLSVFFPDFALFFVLIPVILISAYTIVYSYLEFKKQKTQQ